MTLYPVPGGRGGKAVPRLLAHLCLFLLPLMQTFAQIPVVDSFERSPGDSLVEGVRIGVAVGMGSLRQETSFGIYRPDTCDCGSFRPATANGFLAEISLDLPSRIHPSLWYTFHLGINDLSALISSGDSSTEAISLSGQPVEVVTRHEFRASLTGLKLAAGVAWEILPWFRASVTPAMTLVLRKEQHQYERIMTSDAVFVQTGTQERPVDGHSPIDFRTLLLGGDLSLQGRIPLGSFITLTPELRGSLTLNSIASNALWNQSSVDALFGVSVNIGRRWIAAAPPEEPVVATSPPPAVPMPYLSASIKARGVDEKGALYENPIIEIEQAPWTEGVPIIPFVFFDSASTRIPSRYILYPGWDEPGSGERGRFDTDSLLAISPVDIHWQLLNIIGSRMQAHPSAHLTITGTVSGDEAGDHAAALGTERAEAVARYLVESWGIPADRITTTFLVHPSLPVPEESLESRQENRRAELRFSDEALLNPVIIHRLATVASPPAVRFIHEIVADTAIAEWYISVVQGSKELLHFDGKENGTIPGQSKQWSLADLRVNNDLTPIQYRLYVRDVVGQERTAEGTFKVAERTRVKNADSSRLYSEVMEHSIVGFNYNSSGLLASHLAQLQEVARTMPEQTELQIVGYTDRVGDPDRNRQLSLGRAKAVYEALKLARQHLGLSPLSQATVLGLGGEKEIYNNSLPEGRLLSRMVRILVIRHVEK